MATVSRAFRDLGYQDETVIHTGQHYDTNMSDVFFQEMEIPQPQYNLNINGLSQGAMTGQMMEGIEKILVETRPDIVLVYGDTNTTMAGALAAKKLHIKVAHVEAGLRSYNLAMPEEINRIVTDRISDLLFCPTPHAVNILKKEGFDHFDAHVILSGDVMKDAALYYLAKAEFLSRIMKDIPYPSFVLCTIHREENTKSPEVLASALAVVDAIHKKTPVVLPLHPRTQKTMAAFGLKTDSHVIDPVGYFDMLMLLKHCTLVMTDSGGLQKEAFFFGKPCLTLRAETEWVELVENGYNIVCGTDVSKACNAYDVFMTQTNAFDESLYGDGHAAQLIAKHILGYL
jgi:UDP-GlcNAc3NAcA epimerase